MEAEREIGGGERRERDGEEREDGERKGSVFGMIHFTCLHLYGLLEAPGEKTPLGMRRAFGIWRFPMADIVEKKNQSIHGCLCVCVCDEL